MIITSMHFGFVATVSIFFTMALASSASNMRYVPRNTLAKRANPTLGNGIDTNDPNRGGRLVDRADTNSGFQNALQMMSYIVTLPGAKRDAVFRKYFNPEDEAVVHAIFSRLLGDDQAGAAALGNIVVEGVPNVPDNVAPAEMENFDTEEPTITLSDDAWVYPDRGTNPNPCDAWAESGITQDMYLLGSIILHEYTHWNWFLGSIHGGEIEDQAGGYGWEAARALDKTLARYNADSYGWYATEFLWAVLCNRDTGYDAPDVE